MSVLFNSAVVHELGGERDQALEALTALARACAVKLIRPDRLGGTSRDAAVERFRLEARAIPRLTSPNTVRLYDFGVSETGSLYFVMELLDFGLVKSVGEDDAHLTADGALTGTPAYMPPERVTGGPGGETSLSLQSID